MAGVSKILKRERSTGDFLLSDTERSTAGLAAIASALVDSGGAIGLASLAGTKEEADKVQFELDGKFFTGWLMWSRLAQFPSRSWLENSGSSEWAESAWSMRWRANSASVSHCSAE